MNFDINQLKKSKKLALFLGMLAGDGCLSISHNGSGFRIYPIRFFNTNKEYVELFSNLFYELFDIKGKIRGRKRDNKKILWEFEKYSVKLYKLINQELEIACGKKALSVRIPSFILSGDDSLKKNFFFGLFITDGGLRKDGNVIFHVASEGLLVDLKDLIKSVWSFDRNIKRYVQSEKYLSYQLTLKKDQASVVLSDMPRSHNSVLRRLFESKDSNKRKP